MTDRCEGCEAPATGRDADGVPLCDACGAACEMAQSRSELTPELLAEINETPSVVMLIDEDVIAEIARQALAAQGWREKASEVPGLSATLDEVRTDLAAMTERAELAEAEVKRLREAMPSEDALNGAIASVVIVESVSRKTGNPMIEPARDWLTRLDAARKEVR